MAIAALLALGVAACAPISTLKHYDPSDGVSATLGQVKVLNAFVLSDDGKTGNLLFSGYNGTGKTVTLNVTAGPDSGQLYLKPDTMTDFGYGKNGQLLLTGIDTKPGSLLPIYVQWGSEQGKQLLVPVLDGALPQYATLLPTPVPTPTPTATSTATPSPTPTP